MYARGKEEDDEDDDYVMFTMCDEAMFVGCTKETVLVNSLVDDSKGCGILDSGCTRTVCGDRWLADYLEHLTDYERSSVTTEASPATDTASDRQPEIHT